MKPHDVLAAARRVATKRQPYFSTAIYALVPREAPGLGTFGVTPRAVLYWDPGLVSKLVAERGGPAAVEVVATILLHEVGHVLRDHNRRGLRIGAEMSPGHRALSNIASDCEINDDLPADWPVPWAPCLPKNYDLPDGRTFEEYYHALKQKAEAQPPPKPMVGAGWCGSGGGHAVPGEKDDDPAGRSEVDVARVRRAVADAIHKAGAKGRGVAPQAWQRWAVEVMAPAKIPWQAKLRRKVRHAVAFREGASRSSYLRPSRRQAAVGYGVGRPLLAGPESPVPRVAVVVDTSGSMSEADLGLALREVRGLLRALGARATFLTADADVHGLREVRDWRDCAKALVGGGGTDFRPAIEAAQRLRKRPELLVYMTDGDGEYPAAAPAGMRVIWCLVGSGSTRPPWGDVVDVDPPQQEGAA